MRSWARWRRPELLEVLAVNAAAPFVLNGKLRALMAATATSLGDAPPSERGDRRARAFIVNVRAMEGKFYRSQDREPPAHEHGEGGAEHDDGDVGGGLRGDRIYMNAWTPAGSTTRTRGDVAASIAKDHAFQTPIDEEDAAARCVAPVLEGRGVRPGRRRGTAVREVLQGLPRERVVSASAPSLERRPGIVLS